MKVFLRIAGFTFLLINSLSALYGGFSLMIYPGGESLHLPLALLEGSIFKSYFFPGLLLLLVNGLLGLIICFVLSINHKNQGPLLFMQGFFSSLFIVIEIGITHSFHWMQLIFGSIAILIFFCGFGLLVVDKRNYNFQPGQTKPIHNNT